MKRFFRTLRAQLMLFYVLGCVLPLVILFSFLANRLTAESEDMIERSAKQLVNVYHQQLETEMSALSTYMELILGDDEVRQLLVSVSRNQQPLTWAERKTLFERLSQISVWLQFSGVDRTIIVDELRNAYHLLHAQNQRSMLNSDFPVNAYCEAIASDSIGVGFVDHCVLTNALGNAYPFFVLGMRLRNYDIKDTHGLPLTEPYGTALLLLDQTFFIKERLLNSYSSGLALYAENGETLAIHASAVTTELPVATLNRIASGSIGDLCMADGFVFIRRQIEGFGCITVHFIPLSYFTDSSAFSVHAVLTLLVLALAFALSGLFMLMRYKLVRPLRLLSDGMRRVQTGNLQTSLPAAGSGEVRELIDHFNNMVRDIAEIMALQHKTESLLAREQVQLMQARLNPHFLYNTLGTIRILAIEHGEKDIEELITHLTRLLRIMLQRSDIEISLRDEIAAAGNYMAIQLLRYPERFHYVCNIEPETEDLAVPSMIVQPLLENAIMHGILPTRQKGIISVRAWREEDTLLITVQDDGVGFSEQAIAKLYQATPSRHIGFHSVHKLLRLNYGEPYGLSVEHLNPGARVIIRLPAHALPPSPDI